MAITKAIPHDVLDKKDFNDEIEAHGVDVNLRKGILCPCVKEETGQPDASCNLCDGWAYTWDAGSVVRAFGPNRRINRNYEEPGSIDLADAYFTFLSDVFVSHGDRFTVPVENIVYSEIFTKGKINALTGLTKEKSRFTTINAVERAVWSERSPATGIPYTYVLHELSYGTDFTIINGNTVSWITNAPPNGARYSIRYRTHSEYLAWAPRGRAEGAVNFPYVYLCKRIDFIKGPQ